MTPSPLALAAILLTASAPQDAVRAESERYTVEALDPGGGDRPARIIVSNNVTSRRHMVMVNSTLGEARRAVIRHDQQRLTIVCSKGFAVVDPAGIANTDEVYGLDAVVSPGGRWIAYRRFFPPTHPGPSEGVVVYDTRQSRDKNHEAYPIAVEREWRAGWPIYPPSAEWKDANAVYPSGDAYVLTSRLGWEGPTGAPALLFSMRRADRDVVVLTTFEGEAPQTCWSALPGAAERWRVKNLEYSRTSTGHTVKGRSSAVSGAPETTITFAPGCSGQIG